MRNTSFKYQIAFKSWIVTWSSIALSLLCLTTLTAQETTISGRVLDADTKEGISFGNIYFEGSNEGVYTDLDGYYSITIETLYDSISVSSIGYKMRSKALSKETTQTINFLLFPESLTLSEVVVLAGENPANAIVRAIVKNKPKNSLQELNSFQYEDYTKQELDLININDEKLKKRKLFKPFAFVFENVDSTSDEKPFLPLYLNEQLSNVFHAKGEELPSKRTIAERTSGVKNKTVVDYIKRANSEFSVYDNWISIIEKPFVSPFSNSGLSYYEYYILDSMSIEGQWSYKLKFKPKRKQENTFYGDFWVADSSFAVQRVSMRMSPDANINFIQRIIIYEEFKYEQNYWLPYVQKMIVDFTPAKNTPGMIARRTTSLKEYVVNEPNKNVPVAEEKSDFEDPYNSDENFWKKHRHEELSKHEASVYAVIDSIKNIPIYRTYVDVVETIVTGYKDLGYIEIGPYFSMYNNNAVEGSRFRFGFRTTKKMSDRFRFKTHVSYGLKDKRFKYGADFKWIVRKRDRLVIGAGYREGISFNSENTEKFVEGNLLSGFYRRPIIQKIIDVKEGKIFLERSWGKGFSNRVVLLHRYMDPYGKIEGDNGFNYHYIPNPEHPSYQDTTIRTTELILKTRFALDEEFIEGTFSRLSLGTKKPVVELHYTAGIDGLFKGNHSYHKIGLFYKHWFNIRPIGWMRYRIEMGKTFGTLPFLLLNVHPGNETYFYKKNAFNSINLYEFASDQYASLAVEHHFDGAILNKIPLIRKLKWRTVAHFRGLIGSLSEANKKANAPNLFDISNLDTYTGFRSPSKYPYMEAGFGIENIFKIIRVDALWRLNYLDNPQAPRFNVRASLEFHF